MLGCPGRRNILRNATCSRGDTEKNDNTTKSARVWPLGKSHDFPSNDPLLNCFNPLSSMWILELKGLSYHKQRVNNFIIHDMV